MRTSAAFAIHQSPSYKWYILTLAALTFTFVIAIPSMSLSVLFDEIATDLQLNLVQVGWIWGIGSVMGIVMGLLGGPLSDRVGPRRILAGACLIMGVVGGARALAWDFTSLAVTMFILGLAQSAIPMNVHKNCGVWFSGPRLGTANGVVSVGMALGFMLGSLLAATVFSPLLGGWRNVLLLYGVGALIFSALWAFSHEKAADPTASPDARSWPVALRQVISIPSLWFYALATLGVASCVTSALGYLPLYLRELGWTPVAADSSLATFHAVSMVSAIPITLYSDHLRARRGVLMVAALLVTTGVGLLGLVSGPLIWPAVILAGLTRDGFMALTMTAVMEIDGVGARYGSTATGLLMACMGVGNVIAPPLGNSLARLTPSAPFLFWAGLALLGFVCYLPLRRQSRPVQAGVNEWPVGQ